MSLVRSFLASLLVAAGLAPAQLVVSHMNASGTSNVNQIKPYIKLKNNGTAALDLKKVTLDYLFYETGVAAGQLVSNCDYVYPSSCADFSVDVASIALQVSGSKKANFRARLSFAGGNLAVGQELTIQWGLHAQGWQHFFVETDDWSFTQSNGQYNPTTWISVSTSGPPGMTTPMVWDGTVTSFPATAAPGVTYRNSTGDKTSVYDGSGWKVLAQGIVGPQGARGIQGVAGDPGIKGLTGAQGDPGYSGAQGATGDKGDPGPRGLTGIQGIQGSTATITTQTAAYNGLATNLNTLTNALGGPVRSVVSGKAFTLILKLDGTLWATGYNLDGELGDNTIANRSTPVQVLTGVKLLAGGSAHAVVLKSDGTVWVTGSNAFGQLGDGTTTNSKVFHQIAITGVVAIAAGGNHTLFLKADGTVWATGANNHGQLGNGTTVNASTPGQISIPATLIASPICAIAAGNDHSLYLTTAGALLGAGFNGYNQLGTMDFLDKEWPIQIMAGLRGMATGANHTFALNSFGGVVAFGRNDNGQFGDGSTSSMGFHGVTGGVQEIVASGNHTLMLKFDGTLLVAGENNLGQLGVGTQTDVVLLTQLATGVRSISAGASFSGYTKTDGTVWAMGDNQYGQFGNGKTTSSLVPVQVPF